MHILLYISVGHIQLSICTLISAYKVSAKGAVGCPCSGYRPYLCELLPPCFFLSQIVIVKSLILWGASKAVAMTAETEYTSSHVYHLWDLPPRPTTMAMLVRTSPTVECSPILDLPTWLVAICAVGRNSNNASWASVLYCHTVSQHWRSCDFRGNR